MRELIIKKYHLNYLKNMHNGFDISKINEFKSKLERISSKEVDRIYEDCAKELAKRLLAKVIKRTPVGKEKGGTLRRGWTGGVKTNANSYADSLKVKKSGNSYLVEITNPVEYASYVEYGHRTPDHKGWVNGRFFLRISEDEIRSSSSAILEKKILKIFEEL